MTDDVTHPAVRHRPARTPHPLGLLRTAVLCAGLVVAGAAVTGCSAATVATTVSTPPPDDGSGAPEPGVLSTYVPVDFVLRQHHVESMPDGPTTWGYTLVRTSTTAPWRIDAQGVG